VIDSGTISKIQKAKMYAEEKDDRIKFNSFSVEIAGENNRHVTTFDRGQWSCDCHFFDTHAHCSHTMAMERVLGPMLREAAVAAV